MSSYFLTLRPYIEIFEVRNEVPEMILAKPSDWTHSNGSALTSETDLVHLASTLSVEAYRAVREWQRCNSKTATLLLLLSTGGVLMYFLYQRVQATSPTVPSSGSDPRKPRPHWGGSSLSWLDWLFRGSGCSELVHDFNDESFVIQGRYFGPPPGLSGGPNKAPTFAIVNPDRRKGRSLSLNGRGEISTDLAPCPNCLKGVCRIKKHRQIHQYLKEKPSSTSSSSYNNSPIRPNNSDGSPDGILPSRVLPPTSTPESADDELSEDECAKIFSQRYYGANFERYQETPLRRTNYYFGRGPPSARLFDASRNRLPPDGRERWSLSPVTLPMEEFSDECSSVYFRPLERDETIESIKSVSGSMVDLVKGAREIRRMIREASVDSLATDLSLEINDHIGTSMEFNMDQLQCDIDELRDNCSAIHQRFDSIPFEMPLMASSRSEHGISSIDSSLQETEGIREERVERSTPDLRLLQRPRRKLWRLTQVNQSESDSPFQSGNVSSSIGVPTDPESLEWESPNRGWHDLRQAKYKIALSSHSASECGGDDDFGSLVDPWEWDCEDFSPEDFDQTDVIMDRFSMLNHQNWLPESTDTLELDLEAELSSQSGFTSSHGSAQSQNNTSCTNSRRGSLDRISFYNRSRQPPSGRSSVDHGSCGGDQCQSIIDPDALVKAFGAYSDEMQGSTLSQESGFQEADSSMASSHTSAGGYYSGGLTLSPVHEAKDEHNSSCAVTPMKKKRLPEHKIYSLPHQQMFEVGQVDGTSEEIIRILKD
ncbi:hypothetical protein TCAL_03016 [Tigriopus californicus]|uniref:Uncharacterized protein n=1 Tax=Tigriopus californicus TaxID=6832 RepID=A0A553NS87_TIGCA|nr:uncharacterized protein LOC131880158 [Tigriopus californicus]XP_059082684.1 uncharacterized protein LOC131880158 [Tigriopus californicus]TRY68301.1 hypothetical protein TCAL_03016 [Tigriopus californicus]|eukprot:TCALIF_03016-PA protein Name:"Protein of unknown function" AED:0.11 eAED:0.11 QI:0/-1/0/1/-1/1/1/0/766